MLRRFHDRFGTAGLVVAVIALIAALGGTAIAAGSLTAQQKKEVTKIAKKYAGKPGVTGAQGPPGVPGTNGTTGTNGAKGDTGATGPQGVQGKAGEDGACSASNPKCVLPSGATETGAWGATGESITPLSFSLPLPGPLSASQTHKTGDTGFATDCPGSSVEPKATAGNLCVYVQRLEEGTLIIFNPSIEFAGGANGSSSSGADLYLTAGLGHGTYAVTAP